MYSYRIGKEDWQRIRHLERRPLERSRERPRRRRREERVGQKRQGQEGGLGGEGGWSERAAPALLLLRQKSLVELRERMRI